MATLTGMRSYMFYVEGLRMRVAVNAISEKAAHEKIWERLSDAAQNQVVQMECIEVSEEIE